MALHDLPPYDHTPSVKEDPLHFPGYEIPQEASDKQAVDKMFADRIALDQQRAADDQQRAKQAASDLWESYWGSFRDTYFNILGTMFIEEQPEEFQSLAATADEWWLEENQ